MMEFQAIVIVPNEKPGRLIFDATSIQEAKAYLDKYVTSFFPGSWTEQKDGGLLFASESFHYCIMLEPRQAND
jgi:hypothetical protein